MPDDPIPPRPRGNGNELTQWRLTRLEKRLDDIEVQSDDYQKENREAFQRLTWTLVGFAFTVAGSAVALLIASGGGP